MARHHRNFAYSTILTAPSPAASGTSISVQIGDGSKFPDVPFTATIWPTGSQPTSSNAEVVLVSDYDGDDIFTIQRAQEGSAARTIVAGDQIAATITNRTLEDAENPLAFWSPFILASGAASGLQTLNNGTGSSGTGSLLIFPVTIPSNMQFAEIIVPNSISIVTSANTASNTYISKFGIYSLNANTFSLISSNSFSIIETLAGVSQTMSYPTSTATSGYGYGPLPAGNLTASNQRMSFYGSLRSVGLQFGGNMSLTGGVYWLGLMSLRSTGNNSQHGISLAGIIGQPINAINQAGTVNGLNPIGIAASQWSTYNSNLTAWRGRHIAGFVTATSIANFGGTAIPADINLSAIGGFAANSTVTILPSVTFVST
jgi:hypothetical protein